MATLNKVMLIGNVGQDPDVRFTPSGTTIANVTLATTRIWKDKDSGAKREETDWHRLVFMGRLAEIVQEYVKKGRSIYVEGRIQTRKWQAKDGTDRYTTEIVCEQMQLLSSPRDESGAAATRREEPGRSAPQRQGPAGSIEDMTDDIPF